MTVSELIDELDLKSKSRKREKVFARYVLYKFLRNQGLSFEAIGKMFNRKHCTIMHGVDEYDLMSEHRYRNLDFNLAKQKVCNGLGLTERLNYKVEINYLEQKVLDCRSYMDLKALQEELQNVILEREEENIFTTFDI